MRPGSRLASLPLALSRVDSVVAVSPQLEARALIIPPGKRAAQRIKARLEAEPIVGVRIRESAVVISEGLTEECYQKLISRWALKALSLARRPY
jgi:hypothetical protein